MDTDLAAYALEVLSSWLSPYLLERLEQDSGKTIEANQELSSDPLVQDLLQNLLDILMAGMSRDPQIRKEFYSK